jgi:hypothetical protein
MKWFIIQTNNGKFYYFKDKKNNKCVWTANPKNAKHFDSTGAAEYYAVKHNVKSVGVKKEEVEK